MLITLPLPSHRAETKTAKWGCDDLRLDVHTVFCYRVCSQMPERQQTRLCSDHLSEETISPIGLW